MRTLQSLKAGRAHVPTIVKRVTTSEPFQAPTRAATSRIDLIRRRPHYRVDQLHPGPQARLDAVLEDVLQRRGRPRSDTYLRPGSHLVYFPLVLPERCLLPDGTDDQHAPDASYKYRLWAGGEIKWPTSVRISLPAPKPLVLFEKITDVKGEPGEDTKIWVQVLRRIDTQEDSRSPHSNTSDDTHERSLITEHRWLLFLREKPVLKLDQVIAPPTNPSYKLHITATKALLFRFSALTHNAHAVHIDPEYTKNEYGLPGLLVHGPLTIILMLEVLGRVLKKWAVKNVRGLREVHVQRIEYRNVAPIFVGEEMTVCCKKLELDEETCEQWQVWVEKRVNGEPSLCVKGTVDVGVRAQSTEDAGAESDVPSDADGAVEPHDPKS